MQRSQSIADTSPDAPHNVLLFTSPCALPHIETVDPVLRPFSSKKTEVWPKQFILSHF